MARLLPKDFSGERYGLIFRLVNESDADFIVSLRTDSKLGRFINKTDNSIEKQKKWTREYKIREDNNQDFYFLFSGLDGTKYGVCRIYNINIVEGYHSTGSWLFSSKAPFGAAFLGDIITHEIAFDLFPNSKYRFDIDKENANVARFAMSFHPTIIGETGHSFSYENTKENFEKYKKIYTRFVLK